jgi:hypothetical protein
MRSSEPIYLGIGIHTREAGRLPVSAVVPDGATHRCLAGPDRRLGQADEAMPAGGEVTIAAVGSCSRSIAWCVDPISRPVRRKTHRLESGVAGNRLLPASSRMNATRSSRLPGWTRTRSYPSSSYVRTISSWIRFESILSRGAIISSQSGPCSSTRNTASYFRLDAAVTSPLEISQRWSLP